MSLQSTERVKRSDGAGEVLTAVDVPMEFQAIGCQGRIVLDGMLDALLDVLPLEEWLHLANNWDGKDCSPHNRRLAAAISASAPPEAWTEDIAPGAATVVAAETGFAFMERELGEPGRTSRPGALSSRPAHPFPAKLSLSEASPSAASAAGGLEGA